MEIQMLRSFLSLFCNVRVSLPYNAILHTNAWTMRFFSWRLRDWKLPLPMRCDVVLHIHFCSPRSPYFQDNRTVWLTLVLYRRVDHYSQLSAFPLWHLHNISLFQSKHLKNVLLKSIKEQYLHYIMLSNYQYKHVTILVGKNLAQEALYAK